MLLLQTYYGAVVAECDDKLHKVVDDTGLYARRTIRFAPIEHVLELVEVDVDELEDFLLVARYQTDVVEYLVGIVEQYAHVCLDEVEIFSRCLIVVVLSIFGMGSWIVCLIDAACVVWR